MQPYLPYSAGSCFPPLTVACYDDYDNMISFKSIPEIEIQLTSNGTVLSHLKNSKVDLSSDMYHMIVSV
ncbi:hypothetical protein BVRB_039650 [Beta vulgaris subsp. vulgaris]|uniref:Uncharacterized protein n=1 Tax=Beta vulgaris subsp. vulgaris TaxID=3555 RepID=A0A0J8BH79_BETVV|nr:hypothetical protein BVRB_039650 [Beta vulgaris subsp. vulgaris]